MKNLKVKKSSKPTAAEQEIIDRAAQQLSDILVQVIDEQNAAKMPPANTNRTL